MQTPPRPIPESYWLVPGLLLAGEYPGSVDAVAARCKVQSLLDAGIRFFIDLTREGELQPYAGLVQAEAANRRISVALSRQAIRDLGIPSAALMTGILDAIEANLAAKVPTYVHCWGGVGRTGTVAGCYLVRNGLTGEEALARLAELWQTVPKHLRAPRSPETEEQREFVRTWKEPER